MLYKINKHRQTCKQILFVVHEEAETAKSSDRKAQSGCSSAPGSLRVKLKSVEWLLTPHNHGYSVSMATPPLSSSDQRFLRTTAEASPPACKATPIRWCFSARLRWAAGPSACHPSQFCAGICGLRTRVLLLPVSVCPASRILLECQSGHKHARRVQNGMITAFLRSGVKGQGLPKHGKAEMEDER